MAANSQTISSDAFSWMKSFVFKISLKFVPKGPIDNNPALFQIMAWRRIGDKPLSEPILIRFTDAFMRLLWALWADFIHILSWVFMDPLRNRVVCDAIISCDGILNNKSRWILKLVRFKWSFASNFGTRYPSLVISLWIISGGSTG